MTSVVLYFRVLEDQEEATVQRIYDTAPEDWLKKTAIENFRRYRGRYLVGAEFEEVTNHSFSKSAISPAVGASNDNILQVGP